MKKKTNMDFYKQPIKLAYFRVVNFESTIGATDWRVMLNFPTHEFETWVFGRRETSRTIEIQGVNIVAPRLKVYPLITSLLLSIYYAFVATRLSIDVVLCNPGVYLGGWLFKKLNPDKKGDSRCSYYSCRIKRTI